MEKANWLKKSLVILVTILTFGLVTPSDFNWFGEAQTPKDQKKDSIQEAKPDHYLKLSHLADPEENLPFDKAHFINHIKGKAEENSYAKFGEKIKPKIEDKFKEAILPKMEEAIEKIAIKYPEEDLKYLAITENPSHGRSEKIFNIYHVKTNEDVIRFHVRQENPPQEGYWFNFHYHTYHDNFDRHYDLGRIYWDRNTPPKWSGNRVIS
jgi:hypothetical protein